MRWRWMISGLGVAAVAAALAIGLTQAGGAGTPANERELVEHPGTALAGSPPALARLHAQGGELLGGDLRARLRALHGHPVVVNKWASWCEPCRKEFPYFQRLGVEMGREVAFLGLDSGDPHRDRALRFLREFPVAYPSYADPHERTARAIGAPSTYPMTLFFRPSGRLEYVHQGVYSSLADLRRDIQRYAIGS